MLFRELTQAATLIFDNSSAKHERKCHFHYWQFIEAVSKQHSGVSEGGWNNEYGRVAWGGCSTIPMLWL